MTKGVTVYLSF